MRICAHCHEEIKPFELIPDANGKFHRECLLRCVVGSLAHQLGTCSCHGGTGHNDESLTLRENAKAAERYFLSVQHKAAKAKFN
jgi:hypothetical protein